MIILDGEDSRIGKTDSYEGLTLRNPQSALTRSSASSVHLPDYDTSEAQHWRFPADSSTKPRKFDSRIWKGALYALGIYLFLSVVIVIPILYVRSRSQARLAIWPPPGSPSSLWAVEDINLSSTSQLLALGPLTLDINETCNAWDYISSSSWNTTLRAYSRFTLPPTGFISIRSNITYSTVSPDQITGSLSVSKNQDSSAKDIIFELDLRFSSPKLKNQTNVCFSKTGLNRGISVFVPGSLEAVDQLDLNIRVLLPQVKSTVDTFVVVLPMLTQTFDDLHPYPYFDNINIEGAIRPITCKFLQASQISVKNLAASVKGTFNVTTAITLDSIKGDIISDITLTHEPFRIQPTLLNMDTGDSAIHSNITLNALGSQSLLNSSPFLAKVTTFNGPLNLNVSYRKNSVPAPFHLQAQNSLAKTTIYLDATYEGAFSAKTKMSQVTLINPGVSPGNGVANTKNSRTTVYDQNTGNLACGWTGFGTKPIGDQRLKQSYLDVDSALGPITLTFGG